MTSRSMMLEAIRSNLTKSVPFERMYHHLQPSTPVPRVARPALSQEDLAERFGAELTAVHGEVHRAKSEEEASSVIRKVLREVNASRVAISDLLDTEPVEGIEFVADPSREDLFSVDVGITSAQLAIAETGTLVLRSDAERNRLISLVPPIHICVLKASDIRATMGDVLEEMSSDIDRAITFITGPSRTSDIELTLAIGVHGPKRLIAILIDRNE